MPRAAEWLAQRLQRSRVRRPGSDSRCRQKSSWIRTFNAAGSEDPEVTRSPDFCATSDELQRSRVRRPGSDIATLPARPAHHRFNAAGSEDPEVTSMIWFCHPDSTSFNAAGSEDPEVTSENLSRFDSYSASTQPGPKTRK